MDLSWSALNSMLQVKTLYHTEKQEFSYPWLSKKLSRQTPHKTCVEKFLQSTAQPHQSIEMPLERAASHIKVTRPPLVKCCYL